MNYKFITLGCKVNSYESEAMAKKLSNIGYIESYDNNIDVVVINTCTVTSVSDQKSRQMIRRAVKEYPEAIVCVAGCYSQLAYDFIKTIAGVDIIIGTKNRSMIAEYVEQFMITRKQIVDISNVMLESKFETLAVSNYSDNTRAFLKIQDGCNNFCSYCIIPYARGPMRSRNRDEVINEARVLVDSGFKEIVLTGIHTAGYGQDFDNYSFTDLLKELVLIPNLKRIRISSIEESEINDEFIKLLATNHIIVDHLHIPLQSGCNKILKLMHRKYDCESYKTTIEKIRSVVPNIAITTDVIVGFPQENEEDFIETYNFIKEIRFSALHVFPYSNRSGTIASRMSEQVDANTKKERVHRLIDLSNFLAEKYAHEFVDKEVSVLFETFDESDNNLIGHTPNYLKVKAIGDISMLHGIYNVRITTSGYPLNYGIIMK